MIISCLNIQQEESAVNLLESVPLKEITIKYNEELIIDKLKQIAQNAVQPVYFLKLRIPYQKIEDGKIVNVTFYKLVSDINQVLERVEKLFLQFLGEKGVITDTVYLLGNAGYSELSMDSFVEECITGAAEIAKKIRGGVDNEINRIIREINASVQLRVDKILLDSIIGSLNLNIDNLLLIQNTNLSSYLNDVSGKEIPYIFYDKDDSKETLEEKLEEKHLSFQVLKDNKYFIIIPNLLADGLLRILWDNGINVEKNVIFAKHLVISLRNFSGEYSDFFHNRIECRRQGVSFDLTGYAAIANVEHTSKKNAGTFSINCNSQSKIYIGENAYADGLSLGVLYSASINICAGCSFLKKNIFRIGPFCKGEIGTHSAFGENIWILIGDGHSIFDINSGKRINYLAENNKKLQFKIGASVYVGDYATIIAGCDVGDNCYVESGTILNKAYPQNSYIIGNPADIMQTENDYEFADGCNREE